MALQRFHSLQPSSIAHLDGAIRRALCDKDPSVMAAALCLLLDLIKSVRSLPVPSLASFLPQRPSLSDTSLPPHHSPRRRHVVTSGRTPNPTATWCRPSSPS